MNIMLPLAGESLSRESTECVVLYEKGAVGVLQIMSGHFTVLP